MKWLFILMAVFTLGCMVIANGFEKEMIFGLLITPLFYIGKPAFACFSKNKS